MRVQGYMGTRVRGYEGTGYEGTRVRVMRVGGRVDFEYTPL